MGNYPFNLENSVFQMKFLLWSNLGDLLTLNNGHVYHF